MSVGESPPHEGRSGEPGRKGKVIVDVVPGDPKPRLQDELGKGATYLGSLDLVVSDDVTITVGVGH